MQKLEFLNAEFRRGLNTTVRRGDKWATRVSPGDIVELHKAIPGEQTTDKVGVAEVFSVQTYECLDDIPDVVLRQEHDKTCQTKLGLIEAMDRAYPDGWADQTLTVISFIKNR